MVGAYGVSMAQQTAAENSNVREINQSKTVVVETCSKADAKATAREHVNFDVGSLDIVKGPSGDHKWTIQVRQR